jgi:hypothetical protein
MTVLSTMMQTTLFASLESYINSLSANIQNLKETLNENTFLPSSLINGQVFIKLNFF